MIFKIYSGSMNRTPQLKPPHPNHLPPGEREKRNSPPPLPCAVISYTTQDRLSALMGRKIEEIIDSRFRGNNIKDRKNDIKMTFYIIFSSY